jgi:hypothetical protein
MRRSVIAFTSAWAGLGVALAATIAVTAVAAKARPVAAALITHESLRQTLALRVRGPGAGVTIRETRRLRASLNVPLPGLDPATVTGDSYLGLRIGDWKFDRPLSTDRSWKRGDARASFRVPHSDPNGRGVTVVRARWGRGILRVSVVSTGEAPIAAAAIGDAAGPVSAPIDGAARLGAQHVHLRGTATGVMWRTVLPVLDSTADLAHLELAGRADIVADTTDSQSPVVTITSPAPISTAAAGTLAVVGAIRDDRSIASLAWSIDGGAETSVPFSVDPSSGFLDDVRGAFSFSVPATSGVHSLRVLARDAAGHTGSATIDFTVAAGDIVDLRSVRWGAAYVDASGRVQAWGYGTTSPTVAPGVVGARVATGNLALLDDGTVTTLHGNPTGAPSVTAPVAIEGLTDVADVAQCSATAPNASFALRADGTVWAWGDNSYGQLGDGTTSPRYPPIQVPGLPAIRAISAGAFHAVALDQQGGVWTWGGLRAQSDASARNPHQLPGLANAVAVSASQFDRYATGAAILADGTLWMWGDATSGQLGGLAVAREALPFMVTGVAGAKSVAMGYNHVLVALDDGTLLARGGPTSQVSGYWGELGTGTAAPNLEFTPVPGLSWVVQVAAGAHTSHAVLQDGTIFGWGQNDYGSVGDGTTTDAWTPVPVVLAQ